MALFDSLQVGTKLLSAFLVMTIITALVGFIGIYFT